MAGVRTKGIIIKQSDFGESDRMFWIFTEDFGIIKAVGRGARRVKGRSASSGQFLCYGEFDFFCGGEIWNINSFSPTEAFEPIQYDFKKLALCTYFAELTYIFLNMGNADKIVLRLLLNTLFVCAYRKIDEKAIKMVFELKLLCFAGFAPKTDCCILCSEKNITAFDIGANGVVCKGCESPLAIKIEEESLLYLRYILSCDIKKMFSYEYPENVSAEISYISEKYIRHCADRDINSLEYYKKIAGSF